MIHPKDGIPHPPYTMGPDGRLPLRLAAGQFLASNFHIIILAGLLAFLLYRKVSNMLNTRPPQRGEVIIKSMEEEMRAARARQFEALQREKQGQLEKQKQDEVATDQTGDEEASAACSDGTCTSLVSAETGSETKKASNVSPAAAAFMARRREIIERCPDTLAARVTGGHRLGGSSVGTNDGVPPSAATANSTASSTSAMRATVTTSSVSNIAATPALATPAPIPIPPKDSNNKASEEKSKNKQQQKGSSYRFADDSDNEDPRGPRKRLPKLSGGSRADWEASNGGGDGGGDKKDYFKRNCGPRGG